MRIDFNPAKDDANRTKHGVSLALAREFDWLAGQIQPAKTVAGEDRWRLVVVHDGIVYTVIFTVRADVRWIISVRAASRKERREFQ